MNWINSVANDLIKDWAKDEGIPYEEETVYICSDCGQEVSKHDFECDNCGAELEFKEE